MSAREAAVAALVATLDAALLPTLRLEEGVPEVIPDGGLVVVRDGRLVNATTMLSPLSYIHEHEAEVECFARTRAARDTLLMAIGTALAADRTLGGTVEWCEPGAPELDFDTAGASARVPVMLTFTTVATPLA
jgi:hypothetical protein